jgi:Protein of unknown function (DUF2917)
MPLIDQPQSPGIGIQPSVPSLRDGDIGSAAPVRVDVDPRDVVLPYRAKLEVRPTGGVPTVHIKAGDAWVTQYGDVSDYILHAGHQLALRGHGSVIIQAVHRDGLRLRLDNLRRA